MEAAGRHATRNVSPGHRDRSRAARIARLAATAALAAGAAALVAFSLIPYETLKEHLDPLSVDREADLSRGEFREIMWRFRAVAGGLLLVAAALVAAGGPVDRATSAVAESWWQAIRRSPRALRRWIATEQPLYLVAFAVILIAGVALRIAFLETPMRYDEATTYNNFVSKPLYVGLAHYPTPNNHVLHTFLAKVSVTFLGGAPWAVRLPALLAGIALVPATFALARVYFGPLAGLLAAALVASSSTLVEYSTNARGYTIVALLTVVGFIAAPRALVGSPGAWAVIVLAGALGLHAVPIMLYPLGGIFVWLLLSQVVARQPLLPFARKLGAALLTTTALTFLLYAPVLAASGVRSVTSNEFVEPRSWRALLDLLPDHAGNTFETWIRDLPLVLTLLLGVGLIASLVLTPRLSRFPVPPLLAVAAWTLPVLALQRVVPFTRVWLFAVPLAAATAAGFYGWLLETRPATRAAGVVLATALAIGAAWAVVDADSPRTSRETGALLDAPAVADLLAREAGPDDRILATGSDTILEYYLRRDDVDARSLLYTDELRQRTFVVVNVLGGQTLAQLLPQLDARPDELGAPRLLMRSLSARVYLVERQA